MNGENHPIKWATEKFATQDKHFSEGKIYNKPLNEIKNDLIKIFELDSKEYKDLKKIFNEINSELQKGNIENIKIKQCVDKLKMHMPFYCDEPLYGDENVYSQDSYGMQSVGLAVEEYVKNGEMNNALKLTHYFYNYTLDRQEYFYRKRLQNKIKDDVERSRFHKGFLLYNIHRIYKNIGFRWHARYYLILALIEDILTYVLLGRDVLKKWIWKSSGKRRKEFKLPLEEWNLPDRFRYDTLTYRTLTKDIGITYSEIINVIQDICSLLVPQKKDKTDKNIKSFN